MYSTAGPGTTMSASAAAEKSASVEASGNGRQIRAMSGISRPSSASWAFQPW
jgi:hypothetical protein